jgi:hypothetical protein
MLEHTLARALCGPSSGGTAFDAIRMFWGGIDRGFGVHPVSVSISTTRCRFAP